MSSPEYPQSPGAFSPEPSFPPRPPVQPRSRLPALLVLLGGLLILLLLPYIAEQVQYAITRGRERAAAEVAREQIAVLPEAANRFVLAAKAIEPSVVGIKMIRVSTRRDEWAVFGRQQPGVMQGQGSGVIVDKDGYILTNFHVVSGADQVSVTLSDGRTIGNVKLVGDDPTSDLAVLKIDASGLMAAPWGDSDSLQVGDQVLAVGSPYGLAQSVTAGIISAKERRGLPVPNSDLIYQDFLQTDAAVNPGNSGGPLVNLKGEVVGINTAIIGQGYQGISFAIPSNLAKSVYEKLKAGEKIARGYLGIGMDSLTEQQAKAQGLEDTRGALVKGVMRGSPAEEAGIEPGDVIVAWNGKPVNDENNLRFLVAGTAVGAQVKVTIVREKEKRELTVTVGERDRTRMLGK